MSRLRARLAAAALLAFAALPAARAAGADETPAVSGGATLAFESPAGAAGVVRVPLVPDHPGRWVVRAAWTGPGIAGLWLADADGKRLRRASGSSPLVLDFVVDGGAVKLGQRLVVSFAPTTARSATKGELRIEPPSVAAAPTAAPPPAPSAAAAAPAAPDEERTARRALRGPGRCLEPLFDDEDAAGRAARAWAEALERTTPAAAAWSDRWAAAVVQAGLKEDPAKGGLARGAIDALWEALAKDHAPDRALEAAVRQSLAAIEDLGRREDDRRGAAVARARRDRFVHGLACLIPER